MTSNPDDQLALPPAHLDISAQSGLNADQPSRMANNRSILTALLSVAATIAACVVWAVNVNNFFGFGMYQNSTVERIDKIEEKYVKREAHQDLKEDWKAKAGEIKQLQADLAASGSEVARLRELVRFERQNSQARAIACQSMNDRVASVKRQQESLEQSIAIRYRPTGLFQAPSKDVPLEDALSSDRRYSLMLQEQILELTREMRGACGYLSLQAELGY